MIPFCGVIIDWQLIWGIVFTIMSIICTSCSLSILWPFCHVFLGELGISYANADIRWPARFSYEHFLLYLRVQPRSATFSEARKSSGITVKAILTCSCHIHYPYPLHIHLSFDHYFWDNTNLCVFATTQCNCACNQTLKAASRQLKFDPPPRVANKSYTRLPEAEGGQM